MAAHGDRTAWTARAARSRALRPATLVGTGLLLAVLLPLPMPFTPGPVSSARITTAATSLGNTAPVYSNVTYNSSIDGFPLAYGEMLPINFSPSRSYPLLVYFHGEGNSTAIVPGGAGNGLGLWNNSSLPNYKILTKFVLNASTFHFLIIAPSPRSSEGFYTNSLCGGPEEQDVMDAIVHEESLRHILGLYALGFSMGSLGALSFVGHHPGMFKGVATTGTLTDAFEEVAYHPTLKSGLLTLDCGMVPSATNVSVDRLLTYLSVARFHPKNFSNVAIWVSAGGLDHGATNNLAYWPFLQVNFTFLTRSCLVASNYSEPANCTVPFAVLHTAAPSVFNYRFIFEPGAGHTLGQLEAQDMFQFFLGRSAGGCYTTTFPPTVNTPC